MGLSQSIKLTAYRLRVRSATSKASREELQIVLEETRKEIERRNKK